MKNRKSLSRRIMKSTVNLPSHAFEGLFIVAECSIILQKKKGDDRFSLFNFFFASFLSTYDRFVDGHYRVAARSRRGWG